MSSGVIHLFVASPGLPASSKVRLDFASYGPFFGLGERFSRAKLDGTKITLRPQDLLGHPDHNWTYIPVPFLFTPRGIGLYLDIGGISTWDLTSAESGVFSVEIEQASLDCYFFVGEPRGMIGAYTSLMGRSPGLPAWAFGVWICSYRGPSKVLQDARRLRQDRIPSSAIWLFDAMGGGDIMGWPLWWTGYYREPRQLTAQLHGLGFKVLTYIHPYLRSVLDPYTLPNPSFNEAERRKFFVLDSSQKPTGPAFEQYLDANLDFTNPEVVDWWEKRLNEILLKYNFDGWMEDFGEWVNDTDQFASGKTGHEMANLYPLLYHEITYEIARKAKADVVEFVRSGYAGSQSFTRVVWGGDQFPDWTSANGLPSVIPAGITAGLSGFAVWGPDISSNGHSKELWIRWTQFGALTPIMRDHLWDRPEGAVSLWYDSETTDIFRRYARLHISLFPYLYTYAHEASEDGMPIIRHLMLQYPSDVKGYDAEGEYLLGENMLVAPVTVEGATTRSLYLPQGYWVDYWTGKTYVGGQHVIVPAPLDHIPILLRAGCIIPFIDPNTLTLAEDPVRGNDPASLSNLILRVFAGPDSATSRFTLYDGTTAAVSQDTSRTTMRVDHSPRIRHYELVLPIKRDPQEVSVGKAALERLDEAYRRHDGPGWWLDRVDSTLHVSVSKDNFELKVK